MNTKKITRLLTAVALLGSTLANASSRPPSTLVEIPRYTAELKEIDPNPQKFDQRLQRIDVPISGTRKMEIRYIFSEMNQVQCVTAPCHPVKSMHRFKVVKTERSTKGCREIIHYGSFLNLTTSPDSRKIEVRDYRDSLCDRGGLDVKLISFFGEQMTGERNFNSRLLYTK